MVAGATNRDPVAGAVSVTVGGAFDAPLTVIVRASDVDVAPPLSCATAEKVYVPDGTDSHV
jgi:hypothetical protein